MKMQVASILALAALGAGSNPAVEPVTEFAEFVRAVEGAEDRARRIDEYLAAQESFPIVEDERWVHFVYRGEVRDIALTGSMLEVHSNRLLKRIEGTDFHHLSVPIVPGVRWEYSFLIDFEELVADPLNPRTAHPGGNERSELALPGWSAPPWVEPYTGSEPGRIEEHGVASEILNATRAVKVYLPHGYDEDDDRRYPLLVLVDGFAWIDQASLPNTLDRLIAAGMPPVIAAFVEVPRQARVDELGGTKIPDHRRMLTEELVPRLDERYRTLGMPESRVIIGAGTAGLMAVSAGFHRSDVFGNAGGLSVQLIEPSATRLLDAIAPKRKRKRKSADRPDTRFRILWNRYELRREDANFDLGRDSRRLTQVLETEGFDVEGRELLDCSGWTSWRIHIGDLLTEFFPPVGTLRF